MLIKNELLKIVTDKRIGLDAWGDVYLEEAISYVENIKEPDEIKECLSSAGDMDDTSRNRLIEAIISVHIPELFEDFLQMLNNADDEQAEIIIDGLRSWSLDDLQKDKLKDFSRQFYGKSKFLDIAIDAIE